MRGCCSARKSPPCCRLRILDALVAVAGYDRKHVIRLFNARPAMSLPHTFSFVGIVRLSLNDPVKAKP